MMNTKASQVFPGKIVKLEGNLGLGDLANVRPHTYRDVEGPISISVSSEEDQDADLPSDFLEPLSPETDADDCVSSLLRPITSPLSESKHRNKAVRQFWKATDYEGETATEQILEPGGMNHVRVHPRFLHSNATSHKWALGAMAELLDNALDEVAHGATFVDIDMLKTRKEGNPMLLVKDNGGGMDPICMRHCMSLGYSAKSKMANTIGQYGNGFKTSTMRLGADVIVFTRSSGKQGQKATGSIGLLSYTFLRETGQQDIIVPMVDFEVQGCELEKLVKSTVEDWSKNMATIKQWSPFPTENDLLEQLYLIGDQGTRIIIYNLWENDQEESELDFDTDPLDIQVRGVNHDPKCISMAGRLANSKHFLTYRHSLRSYAAILYLRLPDNFKIILRGSEIKHHSIIGDLMFTEKHTYRPHGGAQLEDEKEPAHQHDSSSFQMKAVVTIGFVKDAKEHVDVQGFNVYHKNRLIKPFWRIWNAASSQGRGVIGVLEVNFVEPAHDKQGFERTMVLARLEARLLKLQKLYWSKHCHKVGYMNYQSKKSKKEGAASKVTPVHAHLSVHPQKAARRVSGYLWASDAQGKDVESERPHEYHRKEVLIPKVFPRALRSLRTRPPAQKYQSDTRAVARRGEETIGFEHPKLVGEIIHLHRSSVIEASSLKDEGQSCRKRKQEFLSDGTYAASLQKLHDVVENQSSDFTVQRRLEQDLVGTKLQLQAMQCQIQELVKERDLLKQELEEERKQAEWNDSELRKKLRETILRVKELETTHNRPLSVRQ